MPEKLILHGASDAPVVDVLAGSSSIVDNAAYGDITGYLNVPPAVYTLNITPGNDNNTIVASFLADLSGAADAAAVVLASGFLNPAANQNGEDFALIGVLPDGTVIIFSNITDVNEIKNNEFGLFPNPASDFFEVNFKDPVYSNTTITISDIKGGQLLKSELQNGLTKYQINSGDLAKGIYLVQIISDNSVLAKKLIIN